MTEKGADSINLPRIEVDKDNQVYNGLKISLGIIPILNTFYDLSKERKPPVWNLFLINVETLVRDAKDKELNNNQICENTLRDCTILAQYINEYCQFTAKGNMTTKPLVCFYLPDYRNIPKNYLRDPLPKGTEDRWKILSLCEKSLEKLGFSNKFEDTDIVFSTLHHESFPHVELSKDLIRKDKTIVFRDTLMISHVPSDFHLANTFRAFSLLESYTGAIKTAKEFGKKVFGDEALPFNKYTHLLFGDKWYLKSPLDAKTKKSIKEQMIREKWLFRSDKKILEKLIELKIAPHRFFTMVNM